MKWGFLAVQHPLPFKLRSVKHAPSRFCFLMITGHYETPSLFYEEFL